MHFSFVFARRFLYIIKCKGKWAYTQQNQVEEVLWNIDILQYIELWCGEGIGLKPIGPTQDSIEGVLF